jgi:general secretion pathway protein A
VYEAFYGLRERPFGLTPDPKYVYLSHHHAEALARLEFSRRERGGFVVVTGDVGTGKTTLSRYFLQTLGASAATALVLYPVLSAAELVRTVLEDLHVATPTGSLKDQVDALHRFLLEARAQDRQVLLLVDEAQNLSPEVLEQVRLISNLETDTEKLLTIVLVGQSELQEMLTRRDLRQLAQRVTARYHLGPLSRADTERYVRHRLEIAGGAGRVFFMAPALREVYRLSGGVPRLINLLCDRALLAGYVAGSRTISVSMVRRAAEEVEGIRAPRWRRWALGGLGVGLLAAVGGGLWLRPGSTVPVATAEPRSVPVLAAEPAAERLAFSLPASGSLDGALDELRALWGGGPLVRVSLRSHMGHLRALDVPAALELVHPARRGAVWVALAGLEGELALVSVDGSRTRALASDLDRFWTRQAVFLFRDDARISGDNSPRAEAWVREALRRAGHPEGDGGLPAALAAFQRSAELEADGVLGPRTLLALYSHTGTARPRLGGRDGEARESSQRTQP